MSTHSRHERIMGTDISITIRSDADIQQDIEKSFDIFRSYETEFSRFRPDSSLSVLNREKHIVPSRRFFRILELCDRIHEETGGVFNPLIDLRRVGYGESFEKGIFLPHAEVMDTDWQKVLFSRGEIILGEHQYLDLGGIVKGYSVDDVRDYLLMRGYTDFIINAGGDIYLAGSDESGPWKVGVDSPWNPEQLLATLEIHDASISTSGTYKRRWKMGEQEYHHIIDPRNRSHPHEIMSISVIGQHTWMTDVYATVGLILGVQEALSWLASRGLEGIIVTEHAEIHTTKGLERYSCILFT